MGDSIIAVNLTPMDFNSPELSAWRIRHDVKNCKLVKNMEQKSLLAWEVRIIRRGKCCRAIIIPKPVWLAYNLEIGDILRLDLSKDHVLTIDLKKVKKRNPREKIHLNKVFMKEFSKESES